MLLQPLVIHPPNISNGMNGSAVLALLMTVAKIVVPIDLCQNLDKLFFGLRNGPEQFIDDIAGYSP